LEEQVILVNENDEQTGVMEKMEAHRKGLLHRAFSIFIFNDKGEMLLQQRALNKYHSPGLWTNACCSHPRPGEEIITAANRRLAEELSFQTAIVPAFNFTYKASFDNGLTEHEFDHVLVGNYSLEITFNENEAMACEYKSVAIIKEEIEVNPEKYTAWFIIAFPKVMDWYNNQSK